MCRCKQPTSNPLITLLKNDLTNIWSKISQIRMILWMAYSFSVKGLEEVETLGTNECALHNDQEHQ